MSLPPEYTNADDYFDDCMSFFIRYRDLYHLCNIDVLTDTLDFHVRLGDRGATSGAVCVNNFTEKFLKDMTRLTPCYESFTSNETEEPNVKPRMSKKKAHEIVHLTEKIKGMCEMADCQTVVDLGAGLGYIGYQIFLKTKFNVLALEGQESLYVNAKAHQRKHHTNSLRKVKYIRHMVSEDSDADIAGFLKDKFPKAKKGFCFTGLHTCGDLTVSAIKLFLKMEKCRALVVTPCCYHKMENEINNVSGIKNFPLSETLKGIYRANEAFTFLGTPFLRVAAQPAHAPDQDIESRVFFLLARALLKIYAKKYNCVLQKIRRKPVKVSNKNFVKYAEEVIAKSFRLIPISVYHSPDLTDEEKAIPFDLDALQSMWERIPETTFIDAALYITYQNYLAPIFENFILYDRLVYLHEQGIECCYYKKVVNETISPKCLSLFASKDSK